MVKMSLDPVQVMSGQVKELKVAPSANGDSRGSWEGKEEFDQDHSGLTAKPKPVSPCTPFLHVMCLSPEFTDSFTFTGMKNPGSPLVRPVTAQFSHWRQMFILHTCNS